MEYQLNEGENVYQILYYHNYSIPKIESFICSGYSEKDALYKFWEGRNKDRWEVKQIHVYVNPLKKTN